MKRKILFVLCLLVGLLFINAGLNKFLQYMPMPKDLPEKAIQAGTAMASIGWLLPLVGIAEIIGGLLLIIPKTRAIGAVVLVPVVVGILLSNLSATPQSLPIVAVIMVVIGWVIAENWNKYLPMISE